MFPLKPIFAFLCKTILMIPLIPSGLYLAEGLVISSMDFMDVDGICFSNWATGTLDNFPSTMTLTLEFPRSEISPVWASTFTEGMLFIISAAEAPAVVRSFPTLITFRSTRCSMVVRSATTSTPSSSLVSSSKITVPRLRLRFPFAIISFWE